MTDEKDEVVEAEDRFSQILMSELLAKIKKKHGASILVKASEYRVQKVPRIPTGIFLLDLALGGGFPAGRVNVVYGQKSSSKTTTLLKAVGNAQQMCGNCYAFPDADGNCQCQNFREIVAAYIDVEGTFDSTWAETNGVDLDRLLLSVPDYAEQSLDIGEALLRSGQCDVLVIDSIAFLVPMKEIEDSVEKDGMGVQSRMIGKAMRKFVAALNAVGNETGRRPTILLTNQIRMKLGVMFGNPETQPGGMAPGFAATTETKMWPGKYEMDDTTKRPIHVEMNFRVEKNKSSVAKMDGSFRLMLADTETKKKGEVYDENVLMAEGERCGLISKTGETKTPWVCLGEQYSAKSHIERKLLLDKEFSRKFRAALLQILTV